jgi:hypothetical protein
MSAFAALAAFALGAGLTAGPAAAQPIPGTTCSLFPSDSIFNTDVSALPVHPQSATWKGNMAQNPNLHPDFGTVAQQYGIPINVAPPPTAGVTPTFTYNTESDHPAEGYPIDQSTAIEGGPAAPTTADRHALVVNKNLCKLYELYNLQNFTNGQTPQAGSGAVWDLNSNAMRPAGWTSADAAGLPITPLLLRPDEILAGSVAHAIRFTTHCTNGQLWPGSHTSGLCNTSFPPMGARFRLRAGFNISGFSANTQVALRAFQHYGLILADNGADWYFQGTTDDWWGTAAGTTVASELKTIPASEFDAVDESALQVAAGSYQAAARGAAALPQDRLHFGIANGPSDLSWMTSSGVPWRYRYQYLAGGVNTGKGWETWNTPTGAFATLYVNASGANGYIPVFTYYELLQSNPSTGANESDRDFSNLNNTSTMNAYYANFKLLMQNAGTYAKPVVVHVEPDLWGYLEQRAAGGAASTLTASVASSGFADVAGIPDTAQGFAFALLKLRDLYGPNVILGIHSSMWGSGMDVATNRSTTLNAIAEADKNAAFLNSAGISSNPYGSTWDLIFNDVDDHDAAWWEQQGADNASSTHWWDPSNTTFPNFTRYLGWVAELKAKTNRPQVVWQVPVGNQYFLTMNNTCGHYQDNVAPYFISHAPDLYAAGLIAVMFGAGNACQTTYTDAQADGITNNNGLPTTDALGYCNTCNTHTSSYADDDGGYLRTFVGQYYGGWKSLGGYLLSGPAAASGGASGDDVFVVGTDRGIWHDFWNGTTPSGWAAGGGIVTADPAAQTLNTTNTKVFVRGTDNGLWMATWNGSSYSSWTPLGGYLTSGPAADLRAGAPGRVDVFVRGSDNGLWHRWSDDGGVTWSSWEPLGGGLASGPGAVSWATNRVDVVVRGMDNAVWMRSWNASTGWNSWATLGGVATSAPAIASCASGHLDVFVKGTDNGVWQLGFNGTSWTGWKPLNGSWTSSPAAICRPNTTIVDLFVRGTDGALWTNSVAGS